MKIKHFWTFLQLKLNTKLKQLTKFEKWLLIIIGIIWASHFIQVLTPEVGYDAVWYHLPVIQQIIAHGGLVADLKFYQTLNPLTADLLFLPGYFFGGELGVKVSAYVIGICLVVFTYALAKVFTTRPWALLTVLLVSTFQVVAWQASSFYIDTLVTLWLIGSIYGLVQLSLLAKNQSQFKKKVWLIILSAILFGATLGSKQFQLLLIPPILFAIWHSTRNRFLIILFLIVSVLVSSFWYIRAWRFSGQVLFPAGQITIDLTTKANQSVASYVFFKTLTFPYSFIKLGWTRDYTSPVLLLLLPSILYLILHKKINSALALLLIFTFAEILLWWYIPPLSTRYALAGFISAAVIVSYGLETYIKNHPQWRKRVIVIWILMALCAFSPRLYVNTRSLRYILGSQTKQQYIEQFYDGNTDSVLQKWHGLSVAP